MNAAKQLALAILRARDQLPRELQALVTPEIAWTLAVLLISWRPVGLGGEVDLSRFDDVTQAFDRFSDTLRAFRKEAAAAKTVIALAGASGLFLSAVKQIGAGILGYLLRSERFQTLQAFILSSRPVPADVQNATQGTSEPKTPSRLERFRDFDNRPRSQNETPDADSPARPQITHWRAQLEREDLSPELRWFYEQKLETAEEPIYTDPEAAERRWVAVLGRQQLNPELRQYFATNLSELQKLRRQI